MFFRETIYKLQRQRFEKDSQLIAKPTFIQTTNKIATAKPLEKKEVKFASYTYKSKVDSIFIQGNKLKDSIQKHLSVIPPEMFEVMLRFKKNNNDTNAIVWKFDSTHSKRIVLSEISEKPFSIVIRKKDKDTGNNIKFTPDSNIRFVKFTKSISQTIDSSKPKVVTTNNTILVAASDKSSTSPIIRYFANNKTLNDSIPIKLVDSAYKAELQKVKCNLPCNLVFKICDTSCNLTPIAAKDTGKNFVTSTVYLGFNTPFAYTAQFSKVPLFILKKMQLQIAGSLLLLGIVVFAFIVMYNSLNEQRKLAIIKNEFISNITHELKTPIATVNVAIEALRSFNAINNPEKTREYLNISAAELQRLGLLVDNVLKLSMFENKAIVLNKEWVAIEPLIQDVLNSLQLQFEKKKATIVFNPTTDIHSIWADKLHITSVLFNLLDNALKYSTKQINIQIAVWHESNWVNIAVSDNGMGIPTSYQQKIFDKFFRVPTNDRHNIKGYGLGLSYVAHIVNMHNGTITVASEEGKGSTFTVTLPVN
ncbi:MAG: sensor histidine kinase [Chitinophagaceae bacterium]